MVRWTGGELEDGLLMDFGIRARFPDAQDEVLEFPVVQRCGDVEQEFTPTITLTTALRPGQTRRMDDDIDRARARGRVSFAPTWTSCSSRSET